jgi:hypothetical protein
MPANSRGAGEQDLPMRLFLVEDDHGLAALLRQGLKEGYALDLAAAGPQGSS